MANDFWDDPLHRHHVLCDKIKPLTKPLFDPFGVIHFSYFFVDEKGLSACLSTYHEWLEFYLHNGLFLHNPFLKNPILIPEGVFFTKGIKNPLFQESVKHAKAFGIEDTIVLTSKEGGKLKGFCFGLNSKENNQSLFVNELPLLKRFCKGFEERAAKVILDLESEPVDIRPFLAAAFNKNEKGFF